VHLWLAPLITYRVSLNHWKEAYTRQPTDVKTVPEFAAA
jgi:hypothetical protein